MAKSAPPQKPRAARPLPPRREKPKGPPARARISAIARDGTRSADYLLLKDETRVGTSVGDDEVKLDPDSFVAPVHAVLRFDGPQLLVQDLGTVNGVFVAFKEHKLEAGGEIRVGRQRVRIDWMPPPPETPAGEPVWGSPDPGYVARAVQLLEGGAEGDVFPLRNGENVIGRGAGDVTFPNDGYVSSKHAAISISGKSISVKDLGSANGTFLRIAQSAPVSIGDLLLIGEQILRIDPGG
ncbi:MAG: FHA domain-containing protein [Myxococcales bacterium]